MRLRIVFICILVSLFSLFSGHAQRLRAADTTSHAQAASVIYPAYCTAQHNVGRLALTVNNNGNIGFNPEQLDHTGGYQDFEYDCFTGQKVRWGAEYPRNSMIRYLHLISLWVGAVVGTDTLVSTGTDGSWRYEQGRELFPDEAPVGNMIRRSTLDPNASEYEGAISEQDYVAVYTDTLLKLTTDFFHRRPHLPLYVEVTQESYAWSYGYAEDIVFLDIEITSLNHNTLDNLYVGLLVIPDVSLRYGGTSGFDDLCGFLRTYPSFQGCGFQDTVDIAWAADADGDPLEGEFIDKTVWKGGRPHKSARGVGGVSLLESPTNDSRLSFNWWNRDYDPEYDFGPRCRIGYRDFRTGGTGIPWGDVNRYHVMSSGEVDYDQAYHWTITKADPTWLYPNQTPREWCAQGANCAYLLSLGSFTLTPGDEISLPFVYTVGENFHTDPNNINNLPDNPNGYYAHVDFSDLAKNATWAKWMYDNPGYDTDGDGYYGKFRVCVNDSIESDSGWIASSADTFWYEGDGIPDWRGATPPPAPPFWVEPTVNGFHVRFNGSRSETERDVFSNLIDFEGYNIWLGRDDREGSYSLVASYDIDDYDKYVWDETIEPANYVLQDIPFTLEELRCLYGSGDDPCSDSSFRPYAFTRGNPYIHPEFPDSMFYFLPHHFNASQLGVTSPIRKVYPDEPDPATLPLDSLTPDRYTEEGFPKYYEYEFTIDNLLSTVPYWVNVTVFDFGSPAAGLRPLETSKTIGAQTAYVFNSDMQAFGQDSKVYVYPNPYRIDGQYRLHGYEGRTEELMPNEKVRAIHFANLPAKCTIRIFTVDGDRVRTIHHDYDPNDPYAHHDEWNMVTRNRNMVMSGLYYWSVEDEYGNVQMGKLVIIM